MQRIRVFKLKPGMKLGYPIYNCRSDELLAKGIILNDFYIKRLKNMGFDYIWIDEGTSAELVEKEIIPLRNRIDMTRKLRNIMIDTKASERLVLDIEALKFSVEDFINQIFQNQSTIFNLANLQTYDDYLFSHSVNVGILSLMTGMTLGYDRSLLIRLGVGALLHDLGKIQITERIVNKPGKLTVDEFALVKKHTIFGYELIREQEELGELPAMIALKHHENYDGSGYPQGLTRDKIPEYVQIVAIADRFDAIISDRIYRKAYSPKEGFEMCAACGNYYVKAKVVQAFLQNIAVYPKGTLVELNNGLIGVVLETPKGYPLFPRVRLMPSPFLKFKAEEGDVSLKEREDLFIVRTLNEDDLVLPGS